MSRFNDCLILTASLLIILKVIKTSLLQYLDLLGQIKSHGCARIDRIRLDFVSSDPVYPDAATQRDPVKIKLLK